MAFLKRSTDRIRRGKIVTKNFGVRTKIRRRIAGWAGGRAGANGTRSKMDWSCCEDALGFLRTVL